MVKLIEVEPGRWRVDRPRPKRARSDLPLPHIVSDIMEPTEQVDGRIYTSKRAFRAVGRALGLTEVGNEKFKPKRRSTDDRTVAEGRRASIRTAIEKFRSK